MSYLKNKSAFPWVVCGGRVIAFLRWNYPVCFFTFLRVLGDDFGIQIFISGWFKILNNIFAFCVVAPATS